MRRRGLVFFLLALSLIPSRLLAWPTAAYRNMAYDALRLMPPTLRRVLGRNQRALIEGAGALDGETASALARDGLAGKLSAELARAVEERIRAASAMVGERRPFRELAFELGQLLRISADLSDPTLLGAGQPQMAGAAAEYHRFVLAHLDKIPMVYDRSIPSVFEGATASVCLTSVAEATTASVPRVTQAFWREGRLVAASEFDYRSVPFAETSLSYSRAVTAASHLWLLAWWQANGDLRGTPYVRRLPPRRASKSRAERR